MSVSLSSLGGAGWQFFDNNGDPLSGGLLYTYLAGTATPAATYTSSNGLSANANPIVLDAAGRPPSQIWLTDGVSYKFVVQTSDNVPIRTYDNIYGIGDSVDLSSFEADLAAPSGSSLVGFLQSGASAVARTVQSKLRDYISVKDYGATGNGVTDDTAFIQNAITANPGRVIFFPSGVYRFSNLTVNANNTVLMGEGNFGNGTVLRPINTTGNDIIFNGAQHAGIESIYISPTVKKTSGFAVYFTGSAFQCFANSVRVDYHFNAFGVFNATETKLFNCQCRYLLGSYGLYFAGSSGAGSYRATVLNFTADNPYQEEPLARSVWAPSTSYVKGAVVYVSGAIWQCVTSGTSGSTPLSGYPGVTAPEVFTTDVVDGTARWRFISLQSLYWITHDNYAYSLVINGAALINGAGGFRMTNSSGLAAARPKWTFAWDLECDHSFFNGVLCEGGEGLFINGSWIGSALLNNGVLIESTYAGEVIIDTTRILGNAQHGVLIQNGPKSTVISGCLIGYNSQQTLNFYHGITLGAGASEVVISGNIIGELRGAVGNPQGYGVYITPGVSNQVVVTSNSFKNNGIAPIFDGGTGVQKSIGLNAGLGLGLTTVIPVGPSPFSWTNNTGSTATVTITTGTVSQVRLNGYQVAASTDVGVAVPQNATLIVTYAVAPVMTYTN